MEERSDAPLADEPQAGAIPNDQPIGGTPGPADPPAPPDAELRDDEDTGDD